MVKGTHPRLSKDPNEERMITWRLPGLLHKRLMKLSRKLNTSSNQIITNTMAKRIEELEREHNVSD